MATPAPIRASAGPGLALVLLVTVASCGAKDVRGQAVAAPPQPEPAAIATTPPVVAPSEATKPPESAHCPAGPDTATIRGKLVFADKAAPAAFTAAASRARAGWRNMDDCDGQYKQFRATAGAAEFVFEGLPPGFYGITLSGDEFVDFDVDPFTVEAGRTFDLGALVLDRGRTLRGRVLTADGAPAAGVQVYADSDLWGDGAALLDIVVRTATTGADGSFTLTALGRGALYVAAEAPQLGRSPAVQLPAGDDDLTSELRLGPTGALAGRVTYAGKPARADVTAQPVGSGSAVMFTVATDNEGKYRFDRLAKGTYTITAQLFRDGTHSLSHPARAKQAALAAGREGQLDLDVPAGPTLVIAPKLAAGAADIVSVVLVKGTFAAATSGELDRASAGLGRERARQESTHLAETTEIALADVPPGSYTLCGVATKYDESLATIAAAPATCVRVRVAAGRPRQQVSLALAGR
ncbi:carboxypeptidase-like regulatory domain-containing protein [Nannocystis sp. ILAH1]|uniref:carboxypeptidase-like regulatory domain-containing protein n=1 Tax=Nannocystis sp. ILAH1 TaxID=2996789 RepID=UPI002271FDD2|nr:carboxypeptidase-like regulatory domain-containing protein [Nannocystis sp. ILAH1]MCY0987554.1 carboxypeptidase-like regulatory domain-containing protein [Nannocystis sp. ILAH1]